MYLALWHEVKGVEQEESESLHKQHIMALFPYRQKREGRHTHQEITEHLQNTHTHTHTHTHSTNKVCLSTRTKLTVRLGGLAEYKNLSL